MSLVFAGKSGRANGFTVIHCVDSTSPGTFYKRMRPMIICCLGATLSRRVTSGSIVDPKSGFNQLYTLEVGNEELGSDIDLARLPPI